MVIQVFPLRDKPKTVAAHGTVTKINKKISICLLAVIKIATCPCIVVKRVLELLPWPYFGAKVMLEDIQASLCPP
jgi:hypothetical protein